MVTDEQDFAVVIVISTNHGFDDATVITQAWADDVLKQLNILQQQPKEFYVNNLSEGLSAIIYIEKRAKKPDLVIFYGHGVNDALIIPGHQPEEPYRNFIGLHNAHILHNKQVCATACCSASVLGKHAVEQGASCYIGYSQLFRFYKKNENFRLCANAWIGPILQDGADWGTALETMKQTYEDKIIFCSTQDGRDMYGSDVFIVAGYLEHDLDALTLLGNPSARPELRK
jgi:hypothetical protein